MKKIALFVLCIMLFAVSVISVAAAENVVWDFTKPEDVAQWTPNPALTVEVTERGAVIKGTGDNHNLTYMPNGRVINLEDYEVLAIGYSDFNMGGRMQFYHWTEGVEGNPYAGFDVAKDKATVAKYNMKTQPPAQAKWSGRVIKFRLDPLRGSDAHETTIRYVGLFVTEKDFEEYNAKIGIASAPSSPSSPTTAPSQTAVGESMVVWDFTKPEDVAQWTPSASTTLQTTENGTLVSGVDDGMNLTFVPQNTQIMLENYEFLVIGYSGLTSGGNMQFYHWTQGCEGNPYVSSAMRTDFDGVVKLDMKNGSYPRAKWSGSVTKLRFDPCRSSAQRSLTIKFIGLFKDAASYAAFMNDGNSQTQAKYGEPAKLYNLGSRNMAFGLYGNACSVDYADDYAVITATKDKADTNIYAEAGFDGDRYHWMKIRLKNLSDAPKFEMHFAGDATNNAVTTPTRIHFDITSRDSDFVEYIVDLKAANTATMGESLWSGRISKVRFDCMWLAEPSGQVPLGSQMQIDYIGFFASEAEAKEFTPTAESAVEMPRVQTDRQNPTWIFDNDEIISSIDSAGAELSMEGGVMRVTPITNDPKIQFDLGADGFDTREFPYFAYRHSTHTTVKRAGLFYTTSELTQISDNSWSPFDLAGDGSWTNTIINLSDFDTYTKGGWTGICDFVRLDPINGLDLNATIYIDRMGFFRTKTEAVNFLKQGVADFDYTAKSTFTGEMQKAIIPAGTLSEGFDKTKYMLTSTTPIGEGTSPVVIRTDENGNEAVVALGYTNSTGYTTFVADRAGTYTLGYRHKDYSDTDSHWGSKYIDFVSDRQLFGGTSPTEFSPDMPMTRGMFITVLGRMHGVNTALYDGNTGYGDVPATEYYAPYIQWAKQYGIMPGLSDVTFGAEDPIYRETMAEVIANYITAFDYKFTCWDDEVQFNDLAQCSESTVSAIRTAQSAGIINGKGNGIFDPKGVSTRAEVATVMQRVIKAVLGVNTATSPYSPDYFRRKRIRIGAWGFVSDFASPEGMKNLRDLGVDLIVSGTAATMSTTRDIVFNYADKYGIEVFAQDFPFNKATLESDYDFSAHITRYSDHPSFSGHNLTDEPGTDSFGWMGELANMYTQKLPGKIPFVNLLPMYANDAQLKYGAGAAAIEYYDANPEKYREYCKAWFDNFDVDYICTDIYPLHGQTGKPETYTTYADYCESINQIATVARENDAEFWCCIQTWGWSNSKRNPTKAEYRWQCYTLLSYGATGILLWSLNSTNPDYPSIFNGKDGGVLQPLYDDCAAAMWEMRNLSDTYIQYRNLGAFTLNCTDDTPWLKMSGEYKDFSVLSETVSSEPLLIGCFDKPDGTGYAFTVVNMTDIKDNKPATLKFKLATPLAVTLYDEAQPTVLEADTEGYYVIELESTDGVFVTIG